MPKHLQVRDVPDSIHRKIKARAALEGKSLSDYLLDEIKLIVNRPTMEELFKELESLEPVDVDDTVEMIRAMREERTQELDELVGPDAQRKKRRKKAR